MKKTKVRSINGVLRYNHLLLVLYQFLLCPLQCAWLLCYATIPFTTTLFWFSISSLCVHYNVNGSSAMLLSLLQPPSSGSLSVCVHYNVHGYSAMLLSLLQPPPSSGSLSVTCVSTTMCMVALLCYCPSYNHLLLVLYQFSVCPLQCTWLLCCATVPLTTTFFCFSISSLCVHYNVHGCSAMLLSLLQPPSSCSLSVPCVYYNVHVCSAMLLSLLQPPSSCSLSVPCVSATMCMVALLCYSPSYNHLLLVISSLCVRYNVHGCSAMLLFLLQPPSSGSLSVPTMCMVALLCYRPSYNHLLLVLYQFPVCPLQCAWLLCYATVPLTTTVFWFSISSLCNHYNVHGCSAMLLSLLQPPSSGSLSVPTMCMVALLCYRPSNNNLLLVLYQFPVRPLKCAWLLCYATVPLTTTFFWFSISSFCVHYNVHGCSAMLPSLLQPPYSGSLSVLCVSTTM